MPVSLLTPLLEHRWVVLIALLSLYIASTLIYRRFFHPLAKIPGPFLAATTRLYQSYYNGRFYLQVDKLHAQYGPVVRITPDEVHLSEAENYDKIYYVGSKYWKSPIYYNALCVPHSTFGTAPNEIHKIRRGALSPMFSRQKVFELEQVVQGQADKVCQRMQQAIDEERPVDLHHAFRAVSMDVISEYAFNKCYDFLDKDDIGETFFKMARGVGPALWVFQQMPSFQPVALKTPPWLAPYLSTPLGYVTGMQMECVRHIEGVQQMIREKKNLGRQTIFTTLLSGEDKPDGYVIPTTMQLKDEAYSILMAASETTGSSMEVAAFNVLHNQTIYSNLVTELEKAFPNPDQQLPFMELEKLPYLTAVIKESLRLSYGVIGRLPRVVPKGGATFHDYYIPEGFIVGMSSWMLHRDLNVFPDPDSFNPERWLKSPEESRRLERNLVPFSRGSRQCVGMPLAYTELYVTIGTLFRRFPRGLKVWNTTPNLMRDYEDFFSTYHPNERREEWLSAYMDKTSV